MQVSQSKSAAKRRTASLTAALVSTSDASAWGPVVCFELEPAQRSSLDVPSRRIGPFCELVAPVVLGTSSLEVDFSSELMLVLIVLTRVTSTITYLVPPSET